MSINAIHSTTSACATNSSLLTDKIQSQKANPTKWLDAMSQSFMKDKDTNGDSALSSQELPGLSADAFKALDTNGDGKLSLDELKAAMQKALDEMIQAMSSSTPQQSVSALQNTPEGQLMEILRAGAHHHHRGTSVKGLDAMLQNLISSKDTNGDGSLSSLELSGLSQDAFSVLDANGDGQLTQVEIKAAVQKLTNAMKQTFETNSVLQAMASLQNTPEGQLTRILLNETASGGAAGLNLSA